MQTSCIAGWLNRLHHRKTSVHVSGNWRGFWDQAGWGRQSMRELTLHFANGEIQGLGIDVIGRFTFRGTYNDTGAVALVKQYRHHAVRYTGNYDGEGTIFGEWMIGDFWRGTFALSPERFIAPADMPILDIAAETDNRP